MRYRTSSLRGWARAAVSAALLAVLLVLLDWGQIAAALGRASPLLFVLLMAAALIERLYSALRWYQLLRWNGANVPMRVVLRISFVSTFVGQFLPGGVGAEALRVVGLTRYSADLAMSFSSVLVDRVLAVFTLVPFVLIGMALAPSGMPGAMPEGAWLILVALSAGGAWLMLFGPGRRALDALLPAGLVPVLQPKLRRFYGAVDAFKQRPRMLLLALLLGAGFQLLRVLVALIAARAVGIDAAVPYFFVLTPFVILAGMLPVSLGGIGVREASWVYLLSLIAVPVEQAFAAAILILVTGVLSSLPGAWLYARGTGKAGGGESDETRDADDRRHQPQRQAGSGADAGGAGASEVPAAGVDGGGRCIR